MAGTPHRVVTLVGPRVSMFELSVACEVFGLDRSELVDPWYRHRVAAAVPGPHTSPEGVVIDTPYGLDEVDRADTVILPARTFAGDPPDAVLDALRTAHARGARLVSMCTGAFVLAAAG
ncbi:MAG: AraC family transcriptional regulator, partial [Actinomycetota bacterium]|nr:AraC family transcriptional regulator [Actinomycetota bacterium]